MRRSPRSRRRRWSWRRRSEPRVLHAAGGTPKLWAPKQKGTLWRPRPASHHKGWTALPLHKGSSGGWLDMAGKGQLHNSSGGG
eukprot:9784829-Lingulodinium_polyedra.AAC.1